MIDTDSTAQIPRNALMKLMDSYSEKRLLYIYAPAGYGKTVSAQLWIKHRQAKLTNQAWISLDEYDNKTLSFCRRFTSALLSLQPDNIKLRETVKHQSFSKAPDEFAIQSLSEFKNDENKYALVIDDLHVIRNEDVLKLLLVLYKRMPASFTILILSRTIPHDVFTELELKNELAIVGTDDLRFSGTEIKALFEKSNRRISKTEVHEIFSSTGGWVIGLRALILSDGKTYKRKLTSEYLNTYLKAHVWDKWDNKTQENMVKSSVAEELTPELWGELTGDKHGEKTLDTLVSENAFLKAYDNGVYRFHDLFREFLLSMLESEGRSLRDEQFKKAGNWFYKNKDYYRAVEYYLKCGDLDGITKNIKLMYNYNSPYTSIEDTVSIIRLSVSDTLVKKYPFLLETLAWASFVEGYGEDMEKYLDSYFKQLPKIILQNPSSAYTAYLLRVMDYRNNIVDVTKQLQKLPLKLFTQANTPSISQNLPFFHRSCRDFSSDYAFDTDKNLSYLAKTIGVLIGEEYCVIENLIRSGLAYEQGDLSLAHEFALTANASLKDNFAPELQFCSFMILAAILIALNRYPEAENILPAADDMIKRHKAFYLSANYRAFSCYLRLTKADRYAAQEWLKNNIVSPYTHISFYKLYRYFITARALIVTKDYSTAILFLKKILTLSEHYRRPLDIIESQVLLAIAYWKRGGKGQTAALTALEQAVITAHKYGYTQIFINEAANLEVMLHRLQKRAVQTDDNDNLPSVFVKSLYYLVAAASKHSKALDSSRATDEIKFTDKQKIVMRYMCDGYSRKEIASMMNISPDGVKNHMKLIYKKLDVYTAVEAVMKINESNILPGK